MGDIDLKVISVAENSNKFQKPGFGSKNQLRTWQRLNVYHSIQVEGIVMCLWCCCKDLEDSNLMNWT